MTDPHDLIQRLADELDAETGYTIHSTGERVMHPDVVEARAYLAQPEPDGPAVLDSREPASVTTYSTSFMSKLSPQAQEVFWAFNRAASGKPYDWHYLPAIAAALRAAADQVVPPALEEEWHDRNQALPLTKMVEIRLKLLAITSELEAQ